MATKNLTIVTNALPRIVVDLDGGEAGYTWVVVATLLTMTASTPIWGKLGVKANFNFNVQRTVQLS